MKRTASTKQNQLDRKFYAGICCALAVVANRGEGTIWKEIADTAGFSMLYKHAKQDGCLRWAGFSRFKGIEWNDSDLD